MVKSIISFLALFLCGLSYSQNVYIPDPIFKNLLISNTEASQYAKDLNGNFTKIDLNEDGEIQISEAENISYLATAYYYLTDITGIEAFKNLTELNIEHCPYLLELPLSYNSKLENIIGYANLGLKSISVENCFLLETIDLLSAKINSVNLANNPNLKKIVLSGTYSDLDLSSATLLQDLRIDSPNLQNLNLKNCNSLKEIRIDNCNLTQYNFEDAPLVEEISIYISTYDSPLKTLNFSSNHFLSSLHIRSYTPSSNLTDLILPETPCLKYISLIGKFSLPVLDISQQTELLSLTLSDVNLSSLNLSKNTKLKWIQISDANDISFLDASKNTDLQVFNIFNMPNLHSVSVKNGKQQDFYEGFINCPLLNYVCCDESEKDFFINTGIQTVVTDCEELATVNSSDNTIQIYPNPVKDILSVSKPTDKIEVLSSDGKLLFKTLHKTNQINLNTLQKGIYIIRLTIGNSVIIKKIIKN